MTTGKANLDRVRDGLYRLREALGPFVEGGMKGHFGTNWSSYASRAAGAAANGPLDEYALLKTMIDNWRDVFGEAFPRHERQKVRNFVSTALEARNATSHLTLPIQDDEALRYLDASHQLLRAAKSPAAEVAAVKALYDAQRMSGIEAPAPQPAAAPGGPARTVRPWREAALPHPDVLANRFKEAEFAADLFAVDSGQVDPTNDYATAKGFFGITFLTEGLKRVLTSVLERLSGKGGDPVLGLQTAFGGGKTHTLLAVWHLAHAADLAPLAGVGDLAKAAGVTSWKPAKVAVFVGSAVGVDTPLPVKDGPRLRTLWGYLGWRLAGQPGLDLMAEAEAGWTSPGSALLADLFRLSGPALILLDELVAYARQLPEERFEAFLSFIQALTEAAKMAPGVVVIGSLPESDAEAGGDKGVRALRRLQAVFGRMHSSWLPASGDETYEIIRRRLFQPLDADGEKIREDTVRAFHDLYKKHAAEFPAEAKEARYLELMRLSYPIHPDLFDRLSKDWASLPNFQRTRGVLRFMANVIGVAWRAQVSDPLITPARIPMGHEKVRAGMLNPIDPAFAAVLDREVDGEGSLTARLEANPSRRISQLKAATRAARAVFLASAPLAGQPNAGLTRAGVRLACVEPGDQFAIFGEALNELSEQAAYLYEEAGRYWFSTQPTLNRLADEKAKALAPHEVDEAIEKVLSIEAASKGGFHWVFTGADPEEKAELSLAILGPATPHAGKLALGPAAQAARAMLERRGPGQRRWRNTLIFVAADETLLATAREAMRRALAWEDIAADRQLAAQLPSGQIRDAEAKAKTHRSGAVHAIRLAWSAVFLPVKASQPGKPFDLEQTTITARDRSSIPSAVYDKIGPKGEALVKETLGPENLWTTLGPLWPSDRPHLPVAELADWFAAFAYMPKLRDRGVMEGAVRGGVASLDPKFGYADGFDAVSARYSSLRWGTPPPESMPAGALLVRSAEALAQVAAEQAAVVRRDGGSTERPADTPEGGGIEPEAPAAPGKPHRFFGVVELDPDRPVKAFDAVATAIIAQFQRTAGTKVKLTLEIEAEAPEGFDDADIGVVRDNARSLKFRAESTGFD